MARNKAVDLTRLPTEDPETGDVLAIIELHVGAEINTPSIQFLGRFA